MYKGKSLNNRKFYTCNDFFTRVLTKIVCVLFFDIVAPCFATHLVHLSTSLRMPSRKKLFGVTFNQHYTFSITWSSSAHFWPCKCSFIGPNKWKSDGTILNLHSSVDFRMFHTLWPQKTNNASLLFHGASWQWSGHVVRPTAQAQTAWSSQPLYDIAKEPFCVLK